MAIIRRSPFLGSSLNDFIVENVPEQMVLLGDELFGYYWKPLTITSMENDGIWSFIVPAESHQLYIGARIAIANVGYPEYQFYSTSWNNNQTLKRVNFPSGTTLAFLNPGIQTDDPMGATSSLVLQSNRTDYAGSPISWMMDDYRIKHRFKIMWNACCPGKKSVSLIHSDIAATTPITIENSQWHRAMMTNQSARALVCCGLQDVIQGNTFNDIIEDGDGYDYDRGIKGCIDRLLQQSPGWNIDICTLIPLGSNDYTAEKYQVWLRVNEYIRSLARQDYAAGHGSLHVPKCHVRVHDIAEWLTNPTSTTGAGITNYMIYTGASALSPLGAEIVGAGMAANYAQWLGPPIDRWVKSAGDSYGISTSSKQIYDNPLMLGTGGTKNNTIGGMNPTGTVPDNWTVSNVSADGVFTAFACTTADRTVQADGDTIGKNLVITVTTTAAASFYIYTTNGMVARGVPNVEDDDGNPAGGHHYVVRAHVQASATAGKLSDLVITCGGETGLAISGFNAQPQVYSGTSFSKWIETPEFQLDYSLYDAVPFVVYINGAVTDFVFKIGRVGCHDVTI